MAARDHRRFQHFARVDLATPNRTRTSQDFPEERAWIDRYLSTSFATPTADCTDKVNIPGGHITNAARATLAGGWIISW
jgi:hypothetical protein